MSTNREIEDDYDFDRNCEETARERGMRVVFPEPNQLQIDLDSQGALSEFRRRYSYFDWPTGTTAVETPSASKNHFHVTITVPGRTFSEWERIAMQAALNDDTLRVFLNIRGKETGEENPTRLFEKLTESEKAEQDKKQHRRPFLKP